MTCVRSIFNGAAYTEDSTGRVWCLLSFRCPLSSPFLACAGSRARVPYLEVNDLAAIFLGNGQPSIRCPCDIRRRRRADCCSRPRFVELTRWSSFFSRLGLPLFREPAPDSVVKPKNCSICLYPFKPGERVRIIPCLHQFHTEVSEKARRGWLPPKRGSLTAPVLWAGV